MGLDELVGADRLTEDLRELLTARLFGFAGAIREATRLSASDHWTDSGQGVDSGTRLTKYGGS